MGKYADRAREMFFEGYNCCQSVVGTFAPLLGFDQKVAMQTVEGLGAGMGRMRLTCGAVSAMAVLAGMKLSSGKPADLKGRGEVYALVQKMANEFKEKNGSIICAELLHLPKGENSSPYPEARTPEYYKKRPCPECIHCAALIVEKYLCEEQ